MNEDYLLQQKLKDLKKAKTFLINRLRTEYADFTHWLETELQLDLNNLGEYAGRFGAIALICLSLTVSQATATKNVTSSEHKEQHVLLVNSDRLKDLSADELRAAKVWNENAEYIIEASERYEVDPKLVFSTIMVESMGNNQAIRHEPSLGDASYGLGQILYGTATHIGFEGQPEDLFEPKENIELIARYHRWNMDAFEISNSRDLAVAYNAGNPFGTPTFGYVEKVNKWYSVINNLTRT